MPALLLSESRNLFLAARAYRFLAAGVLFGLLVSFLILFSLALRLFSPGEDIFNKEGLVLLGCLRGHLGS